MTLYLQDKKKFILCKMQNINIIDKILLFFDVRLYYIQNKLVILITCVDEKVYIYSHFENFIRIYTNNNRLYHHKLFNFFVSLVFI